MASRDAEIERRTIGMTSLQRQTFLTQFGKNTAIELRFELCDVRPGNQDCYFYRSDARVAAIVLGALKAAKRASWWQTDAEWVRVFATIAEPSDRNHLLSLEPGRLVTVAGDLVAFDTSDDCRVGPDDRDSTRWQMRVLNCALAQP